MRKLTVTQAKCEAEAICKLGELATPYMSQAIARACRQGHDELANLLIAQKESWARAVQQYASKLEREAEQQESRSQIFAVTADMRSRTEAERAVPRDERMGLAVKRVLAAHGPKTHLAVAGELPDAS